MNIIEMKHTLWLSGKLKYFLLEEWSLCCNDELFIDALALLLIQEANYWQAEIIPVWTASHLCFATGIFRHCWKRNPWIQYLNVSVLEHFWFSKILICIDQFHAPSNWIIMMGEGIEVDEHLMTFCPRDFFNLKRGGNNVLLTNADGTEVGNI